MIGQLNTTRLRLRPVRHEDMDLLAELGEVEYELTRDEWEAKDSRL